MSRVQGTLVCQHSWTAHVPCGAPERALIAYHSSVTPTRGALTPEQQLKVLSVIWDRPSGADGWVFLPWIPGDCKDKATRRQNWNEGPAYKWPQDRDRILKHLENHRKDDLYFTPTTFLGESRIAQHTGEETVLYADLDEVDPREIEAALRPTVAWETSPDRYQAVWVLEGFADGATDAGGLNHRLTAYLGADPSGWDCTQLLRVPGRRNYKPDYRDDDTGEGPPGRLLWVNNKRFANALFERMLPTVETYGVGEAIDSSEIADVDRQAVWGRVRLKVSHVVREYMSMKSRQIDPEQHDRSEIMWQIERDLADAGCSVAEIVAIVKPTPWNKHAGRNNEIQQLITEAQKARGIAAKDAEEETLEDEIFAAGRPQEPIWIRTLVKENITRPQWLVNDIWTLGSCGFIAAEPKSYKSYFGLDMALSIASGTHFLNHSAFGCKERPVLFLQEEDPKHIVVHRIGQILEQKAPGRSLDGRLTFDDTSPYGADSGASGTISDIFWMPPERDVIVAMHVRTGFVVSDPAWQAWLMEFILEYGFAHVFIDTLGTTLGSITLTDDGLYPKVLNPLKEISAGTGAGISIIHHNKKGEPGSTRRGQLMSGSVALHAWAESALYLSKDEHESSKPALVKVERESKMAMDMKFRVEIPQMFEEKGPDTEGDRQLWQPEVKLGWAEQEVGPGEETLKDKPGQMIHDFMVDRYTGEWVPFSRIVSGYKRTPNATQNQLDRAVKSELIERDGDRYRVRA